MEKFIDEIYMVVQAGTGGDGIVSFERMKFMPIGKPAGGDGGKGGDVILKIDPGLSELSSLRNASLIKAGDGADGARSRKKGKDGHDTVIKLPPGIIIKDYDTKEIIAELIENQQEYVIAYGGKGGNGNYHFKSSTNRSPRRHESGRRGENKKIIIELKLLADIGLVGFPNAGKSTLLASFTDAKPKIDSYPFTTLTPNLGIFNDEDLNAYTIADIPGLIQGSHEGKGLGIQFLKHIERTKILCIIVDVSEKDFEKKKDQLLYELEAYNPALAEKKIILAGNKVDLLADKALIKKYKKDYILISALNKINLEELKKVFIKTIKGMEK